MRYRVVCSLRNISSEESIYSFRFNRFRLLKGQNNSLSAKIFTSDLISEAGQMLMRQFSNNPYFFTSFIVDDTFDIFASSNKFSSTLNQLINFTWFKKDNAINIGSLHTFCVNQKNLVQVIKQGGFSNSVGESDDTTITKEDLQFAAKIYKKFESIASDDSNIKLPKVKYDFSIGRPVSTDGAYHFKNYNENTIIEKALSFLTMARTNSFLPQKIALYMSLLECLFTTDRAEVMHKVCERVALYIGGSYEEKRKTYDTIKAAYEIRSGFFHGDDIGGKNDSRINLQTVSKSVDNMLRTIMTKAILKDDKSFNGSKKERKEFLFKMVMK